MSIFSHLVDGAPEKPDLDYQADRLESEVSGIVRDLKDVAKDLSKSLANDLAYERITPEDAAAKLEEMACNLETLASILEDVVAATPWWRRHHPLPLHALRNKVAQAEELTEYWKKRTEELSDALEKAVKLAKALGARD